MSFRCVLVKLYATCNSFTIKRKFAKIRLTINKANFDERYSNCITDRDVLNREKNNDGMKWSQEKSNQITMSGYSYSNLGGTTFKRPIQLIIG